MAATEQRHTVRHPDRRRIRMSPAARVTPLHEAATLGNAAIVNALLRAGAQANAAYGEGETALMVASRSGSAESVKLLLEAGAEVNAAEKFRGQTALMLAAVENHAPVVKVLLAAGAQPNTPRRSTTFKSSRAWRAESFTIGRKRSHPLILAARKGTRGRRAAHRRRRRHECFGAAVRLHRHAGGHLQRPLRVREALIEKGANLNEARCTRDGDAQPSQIHKPGRIRQRRQRREPMDVATLLLRRVPTPTRLHEAIPPRQAQGNSTSRPLNPAYRAVRSGRPGVGEAAGRGRREPVSGHQGCSTPMMAAAGLGARARRRRRGHRGRDGTIQSRHRSSSRKAGRKRRQRCRHAPMHYAVQRGTDRIIEYWPAKARASTRRTNRAARLRPARGRPPR